MCQTSLPRSASSLLIDHAEPDVTVDSVAAVLCLLSDASSNIACGARGRAPDNLSARGWEGLAVVLGLCRDALDQARMDMTREEEDDA